MSSVLSWAVARAYALSVNCWRKKYYFLHSQKLPKQLRLRRHHSDLTPRKEHPLKVLESGEIVTSNTWPSGGHLAGPIRQTGLLAGQQRSHVSRILHYHLRRLQIARLISLNRPHDPNEDFAESVPWTTGKPLKVTRCLKDRPEQNLWLLTDCFNWLTAILTALQEEQPRPVKNQAQIVLYNHVGKNVGKKKSEQQIPRNS